MVFRTSYDRPSSTGEKISFLPSMTIPDQTLTIRQIMDRYTRGLPLDVHTYEDDAGYDEPDFDDAIPPGCDVTEVEEMLAETQQKIKFAEHNKNNQIKSNESKLQQPVSANAAGTQGKSDTSGVSQANGTDSGSSR